MTRSFVAAIFVACISNAANAHEFWIDPVEHMVDPGQEIVAALRVGQDYDGISYGYLPPRFNRFDYAHAGQIQPVEGRVGDRPALTMTAPSDGLLTLIHETTDSRITWEDFQDFVDFVEHKDATWTLDAHRARGFPEENVTEVYSRYVKSLIAIGSGAGSDVTVGLLTEIVALENPYTGDTGDGVDVRLLYQDAPRVDEQIEIYEKAPTGEVTVTLTRTDADGVATIPVQPGHRYMLDAVVLREGGETAQWESLWANLTFAVPDA